MFGLLDRIQHAHLSGFPLLIVMLACFLVGAFCSRLALELDAKALWAFILSRKPTSSRGVEPEAGEDREIPR